MKLQELLKNIEPVQIIGDADVEVTGVNIDSRKIKEGHLFVACLLYTSPSPRDA